MKTILRGGVALGLVVWLFLPAIVADTGDDGREAPRRGELNRSDSTGGDSDEPVLVESGIDPVVESLGERRDLQPRFDDDGSNSTNHHRRRRRRNDERSDERDDEFPEPDEDEDGDMTPFGP